MSTWMTIRGASAAAVVVVSAIGCNVIFGIEAGEPRGKGRGGAGGEGGTGGTSGTGTGGTGGDPGCQPSKPASCDPALLADDENCCVAGRSCQGGACAGGECQEVEIAVVPDGEEGISVVVADATVIWSSGYGRSIYATGIDGGPRGVLVGPADTDFEYVTMLAVDEDRRQVYFTDYGGARIGRAGIDSGGVEVFGEIPVSGAKAGFGRILVHDDYVYVALDREVTPSGTASVFRAPVTATTLPVTFEKVADALGAFGIAATGGYLYFGDEATTSIKRIAIATIGQGGVPEVVVSNQPAIGELAVDANRVYWPDGHTIWAHGLAPGGPKYEVGTNESNVWGLVADGDYIYWSTVGDSATVGAALRRIDAALEGQVTTLVFLGAPMALDTLSADCDTLYVIERTKGRVLKLSK